MVNTATVVLPDSPSISDDQGVFLDDISQTNPASDLHKDDETDGVSASEDTLVEEYFETLHMIEYFSRQPKSGTESAAIDASGTVTDAKGEETVTVSSSDEMGKPDKHKRSLKELKDKINGAAQDSKNIPNPPPASASTTTEPLKAVSPPYLYFEANTSNNPSALGKDDPFVSKDKSAAGSLFRNIGATSKPASVFGAPSCNKGLPEVGNKKPKPGLFEVPNVKFPIPKAKSPDVTSAATAQSTTSVNAETLFQGKLQELASVNLFRTDLRSDRACGAANALLSNSTPSIFQNSSATNNDDLTSYFGKTPASSSNNLFSKKTDITKEPESLGPSQINAVSKPFGGLRTADEVLEAFPDDFPALGVFSVFASKPSLSSSKEPLDADSKDSTGKLILEDLERTGLFGNTPSLLASFEPSNADAKASMDNLIAGLAAISNPSALELPKDQSQLSSDNGAKDAQKSGGALHEAKPSFVKYDAENPVWQKSMPEERDSVENGNSKFTSAFATTGSLDSAALTPSVFDVGAAGARKSIGERLGTAGLYFIPIISRDPVGSELCHNQSLTFMEPYVGYSFEELRLVDYAEGRRRMFDSRTPAPPKAISSTALVPTNPQELYGTSESLYNAIYGPEVDRKIHEKMAAAQEHLRKIDDGFLFGTPVSRNVAQTKIAEARLAYHVACLDSWVISRYKWKEYMSSDNFQCRIFSNPFDHHLQKLWNELKAHKTALESKEEEIGATWPFDNDENTLMKHEGLVKLLNQM